MSDWKKISGDVDAENWGATFGKVTGDEVHVVKITPLAQASSDFAEDDKHVCVDYACYTTTETDQFFADNILVASLGVEQSERGELDYLDKADRMIDYGWEVDWEIERDFPSALLKYTGLNEDPGF